MLFVLRKIFSDLKCWLEKMQIETSARFKKFPDPALAKNDHISFSAFVKFSVDSN